jgi:hypothetical protein
MEMFAFACAIGGADGIVTPQELYRLATVIEGRWVEFALDLAPDLFQVVGNISTIQRDLNYASARVKAQAMLETWRNNMDTGATCRLLIEALCRDGMRKQACDIFGVEITTEQLQRHEEETRETFSGSNLAVNVPDGCITSDKDLGSEGALVYLVELIVSIISLWSLLAYVSCGFVVMQSVVWKCLLLHVQ